VHGFIYRWPSTRTSDERIEAWLTWIAWPGYSFMRRKLGGKATRPDPDRVRSFSPNRIYQADL
jgi:lipid A 4'-phosphatase